jgi:hypothetical protein
LQGFPVSLVAAAFNSAGAIIVVIGLPVFTVFFAYQPVEVVVLVDVTEAVIQAVNGAPIRQGGGDAVAQWVVLVAEGALCGGFAQQVTQQIVAEGDEVGFCFCGQAGFFVADFDKVVGFVVLVGGGAVGKVDAVEVAECFII